MGSSIDDDVEILCKEAVRAFKIWPADVDRYRQEWRTEIYRAALQGRAMERIIEIRKMVLGMPRLTPVTPRMPRTTNPPRPRAPTPWRPAKANWGIAKQVNRCELWEAVVLSANFDPQSFHPENGRLGKHVLTLNQAVWAAPEAGLHFMRDGERKRLRGLIGIAVSHIGDGIECLDPVPSGHPFRSTVRLREFGTWARGMQWKLPKEFPGSSPASPRRHSVAGTDIDVKAKSLTTKERTTLLVIIGALAKKARLDLTRPTLAAKEIERIAREDLKAEISERSIDTYLKAVEEALDRRAIDRKD
jgi:hypothetical protein